MADFQIITVAFRTWPWMEGLVNSFREVFPSERLVVVDNNPPEGDLKWLPRCETEREWLRQQPDLVVIENPGTLRTAGAGIDFGLWYCRPRGVKFLVHIEPDCEMTGRDWLDSLLAPCREGAWMSGSHRKIYGPIHPTPSVWRTDCEWGTFSFCPRGLDVEHPRFAELFDLAGLLAWTEVHDPNEHNWWKENWDTAQRNWFLAAAANKAVFVEPAADFKHFWYGSQGHPSMNNLRT